MFEVRGHLGAAVLDLRSPRIEAGDITVTVDLDHGNVDDLRRAHREGGFPTVDDPTRTV